MNAAAIDFSILWPALIAGLLVIALDITERRQMEEQINAERARQRQFQR